MRLVLLGPPGIGKGTQAKILAEKYGLLHLSSGDILRREIAEKTKLGLLATSLMDKGRLVPDDVTLDMMARQLEKKDAQKGYILDGFPRTLSQGKGLKKILEKLDQKLDVVFALEGDTEVLIKRLSGRRSCRKCGTIINLFLDPPKVEETCQLCGGELYQRDDDKPNIILERLNVYQHQTEPLISYYSQTSLLKKVSGTGTIKQVSRHIIQELPKRKMED